MENSQILLSKTSLRKTIAKINLDDLSPEDLTQYTIIILQKSPELRSAKEIDILYAATSKIIFFVKTKQEHGEAVVKKCLSNMEHTNMEKNEIVFRNGSIGDKFYVILSGSVGVLINLPKEIKDDNGHVKTVMKETQVAVINAGSGFGEVALINDAPRTASIVCKEDCDFATLDKKNFKKILAEAEKKIFNAKVDFILSFSLFSNLQRRNAATLSFQFQSKEYIYNDPVYLEGENPEYFYIIKSGQFKLIKTLKICKEESYFLVSRRQFLPRNYNKYLHKRIELGIVSGICTFGEEELVSGMKRLYSVYCFSQKAEVLRIARKDLLKRLENSPEFTYLKKQSEVLLARRLETIKKIERNINQNKNYVLCSNPAKDDANEYFSKRDIIKKHPISNLRLKEDVSKSTVQDNTANWKIGEEFRNCFEGQIDKNSEISLEDRENKEKKMNMMLREKISGGRKVSIYPNARRSMLSTTEKENYEKEGLFSFEKENTPLEYKENLKRWDFARKINQQQRICSYLLSEDKPTSDIIVEKHALNESYYKNRESLLHSLEKAHRSDVRSELSLPKQSPANRTIKFKQNKHLSRPSSSEYHAKSIVKLIKRLTEDKESEKMNTSALTFFEEKKKIVKKQKQPERAASSHLKQRKVIQFFEFQNEIIKEKINNEMRTKTNITNK